MTLTVPRGTLEVARELLDAAIADARSHLVKASRASSQRRRARAINAVLDPMTKDIAAYFEAMATRIGPVHKAVQNQFDPDRDVDWPAEEKALREVIGRWYLPLGEEAYAAAGDELGVDVPWDVEQPGVKRLLATLARQVRRVTDASRAKVRARVSQAVERGYSLEQLVGGVDEDGFEGLKVLVSGWASTLTGRAGSRAALIAVTETATAYNSATLNAYRDSGVVQMVHVFDGEACGWRHHDDEDKANGTQRTVDDATEHPIAHPRCQRAFGPITDVTVTPEAAAAPSVPLNEASRAVVDKQTTEAWDQIQSVYADDYPTIEDLRAAVEKSMRELVDQGEIRVRVYDSDLQKILDSGRFKTQFEVKRSGGKLDNDLRAKVEQFYFDYAKDLPAAERPVYGYLGGEGDNWKTDQYGDVVVEMRRSVRDRSSITFYDSLDAYRGADNVWGGGQGLLPSALNAPSWQSALPWDPGQLYGQMVGMDRLLAVPGYPEVQIHGGLPVTDIERVVFTRAEPTAEIKAALDAAKVSWSWDPAFVQGGTRR